MRGQHKGRKPKHPKRGVKLHGVCGGHPFESRGTKCPGSIGAAVLDTAPSGVVGGNRLGRW